MIFTHVQVYNETVQAYYENRIFDTFKKVCAAYTRTTCGLSFAMRTLNEDSLSDKPVQASVRDLQKKNRINHLGVLDAYGTAEEVNAGTATILPAVFSTMRKFLGKDTVRNKVFMGIGYFYYNNSDAWLSLARTALRIMRRDVDVLVVITTVLSVPTHSQCITLASNALKSEDAHSPNMESAFTMIRDRYGTPSVLIAFSLQMGVIMYSLKGLYTKPADALYKPCYGFAVTDYSQACQLKASVAPNEKSMIATNTHDSSTFFNRTIFQTYDTVAQMKEKAAVIMSKPNRRGNFTWFLFNVELTDITRQCVKDGPHKRLKEFKKFFVSEAQKTAAG